MTSHIVFIKDKEYKKKVRYAVKKEAGFPADWDFCLTGSIWINKDSDLAVLDEIILQIN